MFGLRVPPATCSKRLGCCWSRAYPTLERCMPGRLDEPISSGLGPVRSALGCEERNIKELCRCSNWVPFRASRCRLADWIWKSSYFFTDVHDTRLSESEIELRAIDVNYFEEKGVWEYIPSREPFLVRGRSQAGPCAHPPKYFLSIFNVSLKKKSMMHTTLWCAKTPSRLSTVKKMSTCFYSFYFKANPFFFWYHVGQICIFSRSHGTNPYTFFRSATNEILISDEPLASYKNE